MMASRVFTVSRCRSLSQVSFLRQSCWNARSSIRMSNPLLNSKRFLSKSKIDNAKSSVAATSETTFLQRFLAPKDMPPRGTFAWYREMVLICTVFAITGTSTMMLVGSSSSERWARNTSPWHPNSLNPPLYQFIWAGQASGQECFASGRKFQRWSLVLSDCIDCNYVADIFNSVGCGRHRVRKVSFG